MYVRLAFAVAAHLEPEIMLVDEVLAVGDAAFQKKCLGKMGDVVHEGRTILFVSHNMAAVENLCTRGLLIDRGTVRFNGPAREAVKRYLDVPEACRSDGPINLREHPKRRRGMTSVLRSFLCHSPAHGYPFQLISGKAAVFEIAFDSGNEEFDYISIGIDTLRGERICSLVTYHAPDTPAGFGGNAAWVCTVDDLPLAPGDYGIMLSVGYRRRPGKKWLDVIDVAAIVHVEAGDFYGNGQPPAPADRLLVRSSWRRKT